MRHVATLALLVGLSGSFVSAQEQSKAWFDVNFGTASAAEREYTSTLQRALFSEIASSAVAYELPRGGSFDVGGGYMFHPRAGLGVTLSGTVHESEAGLAIRIPHPNFFNAFAIDSSVTERALRRSEGAWHIQGMFVLAETPALRVRTFGGPSYFSVEQDTVRNIMYGQVFQVFNIGNAVEISSYESERSRASGWGFNGGVDLAYFFSRIAGVGFVLRASRATVRLDDYGGELDVKAGGVQMGGGLRMRF